MNKITIILLSAILFSGCLTEKKLAQKCADRFPVKDSLVVVERLQTDTVLLAGYEVLIRDTVICPPSATSDTIMKTITRWRKGKTITIQHTVHDTLRVRENTSEIRLLEIQLADAYLKIEQKDKKLSRRKGKVSKFWRWGFWMAMLTVLILASGLRRR